jgi:hypothetical protein
MTALRDEARETAWLETIDPAGRFAGAVNAQIERTLARCGDEPTQRPVIAHAAGAAVKLAAAGRDLMWAEQAIDQADLTASARLATRARLRRAGRDLARVHAAMASVAAATGQALPPSRPMTKAARARELVEQLVPQDGGWWPSAPVFAAAKAEGLGARNVDRARIALGLTTRRTQTFPATWQWRWKVSVVTSVRCECDRPMPLQDGTCGKCGRANHTNHALRSGDKLA